MKIFGYEFDNSKRVDRTYTLNMIPPENDRGSIDVNYTDSYAGVEGINPVEFDNIAQSETQLIEFYREMRNQPEVAQAIDEITCEAIGENTEGDMIKINLDKLDYSAAVKEKIDSAFSKILNKMDYNNRAYWYFSQWFVDGRINLNVDIDPKNVKKGIQNISIIDPRTIRYVREIEETLDKETGINTKQIKREYYVYRPNGFRSDLPFFLNSAPVGVNDYAIISRDAIVRVTSGLLSTDNRMAISFLNDAIKPYNKLRLVEDSAIVYLLTRSVEKKVFYIDTGKTPPEKADALIRDMMERHKNSTTYDPSTGTIQGRKKFMHMTQDYFFGRREGSRGTEVDTISAGANLSDILDYLKYFREKLYESLYVPRSRLENENMFQFGKPQEMTVQNVRFSKFIARLRSRYSQMFDELLKIELLATNVIKSEEEWETIRNAIVYRFTTNSYFAELKEQELFSQRIDILNSADVLTGKYFSKKYVMRNILKMSEEEIAKMEEEMKNEAKDEMEQFNQQSSETSGGGDSEQTDPLETIASEKSLESM